jgi:hypothetical protein
VKGAADTCVVAGSPATNGVDAATPPGGGGGAVPVAIGSRARMTSCSVPFWSRICCTMWPAGTVSGIGIGGLELVVTIRILAGPEMKEMKWVNKNPILHNIIIFVIRSKSPSVVFKILSSPYGLKVEVFVRLKNYFIRITVNLRIIRTVNRITDTFS